MEESILTNHRDDETLIDMENLIQKLNDTVAYYKVQTDTRKAVHQKLQQNAEEQIKRIQNNIKNLESKFDKEKQLRTDQFSKNVRMNQQTKLEVEQNAQRFAKELHDVKLHYSTETKKQLEATSALKNETEHMIRILENQFKEGYAPLQEEWKDMNLEAWSKLRQQQQLLKDIKDDNQFRKDRLKSFIIKVEEDVRNSLESIKADSAQLQRSLEKKIQEINTRMSDCEAEISNENIRLEEANERNKDIKHELDKLEQTTRNKMKSQERLSSIIENNTRDVFALRSGNEDRLCELELNQNRTREEVERRWNELENECLEKMRKQQDLIDDIRAHYMYLNDRWKLLLKRIEDSSTDANVRETEERMKKLEEELRNLKAKYEKNEYILMKEIKEVENEKRVLQSKRDDLNTALQWNQELHKEMEKIKAEIQKRENYITLLEERLCKTRQVIGKIDEYDRSRYEEYKEYVRVWTTEDSEFNERCENLRRNFQQLPDHLQLKALLWIQSSFSSIPENCNYAEDFKRLRTIIENFLKGDYTGINDEFTFQQVEGEWSAADGARRDPSPDIHDIEIAIDAWISNLSYFSFWGIDTDRQSNESHLKEFQDSIDAFIVLLKIHFRLCTADAQYEPEQAKLLLKTLHIYERLADLSQDYAWNWGYFGAMGKYIADKLRHADSRVLRSLCSDFSQRIEDEFSDLARKLTTYEDHTRSGDRHKRTEYYNYVAKFSQRKQSYLQNVMQKLQEIQTTNPRREPERFSVLLDELSKMDVA